jgi:parvulin-like peptidyl-prolyl isomerase
VVVHSGIRERELEPIELSRGRALDGVVVDPSGRPFAGIRIAARWRVPGSAPENKYAGDSTTQSWATADSQGRFRFDDLAVDVETTLTAVRAEIELAEPLPVDPKTDKPVQLQTARSDFAAISGRVIDRVGAPVSGAEIVVQWLRSKEIVDALRLHTDAAGRFETPAYFPKEFEYRLKVRSRCRDAATSPPRALAESTERFPDLVIDRPDPVELSKLAGGEVVAIVNGQPIFAKEIFERAYPEPLNNGGLSLLVANQNFASGRVTEAELRSLQDVAIRKYLKDYIRTRLLARALTSKLEKEQLDKIEEAIGKMFDEYVDKLKKDLKVRGRFEVEQKLRQQGTSLSSLKAEFRYRLLADEYLRSKRKEFHVSREATEAYYQRHLQDYSEPERVRWQLLEIRFDQHGGREKALALAEKLAAEAKRGEDFTTLVRTYSDGPRAEAGGKFSWTKPDDPQEQEIADAIHKIETGDIKPAFSEPVWSAVKLVLLGTPLKERDVVVDGAERALWQERVEKHLGKHFDRKYFDNGGKQPWTNPANLTDSTISAALRQLAPGEISRVLAGSESYRILRLIERRPAGRKPFDEVEPSIRQKVEDQQQDQLLFDLYDRATIESPYFPEHQTHSARRVSAGAPQVDSSGEYLFPTIVSPRAFKIERRIDFPEEAPHRNCA